MYIEHPLSSLNYRSPAVPEQLQITDNALQQELLLSCHEPKPLFYQAPPQVYIGDAAIQRYRVLPYDEVKIKKYEQQQADLCTQSIFEIQQLITQERARLVSAPVVVQTRREEIPIQSVNYQTSTQQILEQLQYDRFQPRLALDCNTEAATITGNDNIAVGGGRVRYTNDEFDTMQNELIGAFEECARQQREQEEQEQAALPQQQESIFNAEPLSNAGYNPQLVIQQSEQVMSNALRVMQRETFLPAARIEVSPIPKSSQNDTELTAAAEAPQGAIQREPSAQPKPAAGGPVLDADAAPSGDIAQQPHLHSSNTQKSPLVNEQREIEIEDFGTSDDQIDAQIRQNAQVREKAAQFMADAKQSLDISVHPLLDDMAISSASSSNVAPGAMPRPLSDESDASRAPKAPAQAQRATQKGPVAASAPAAKPVANTPAGKKSPAQKKLTRKPGKVEKAPAKAGKTPASVKHEEPNRPKSVMHQVDELNDSEYIRNLLNGNDSTFADASFDNQRKNFNVKKPTKIARAALDESDSFLRQLDAGTLDFKTEKDDFDLDLDDVEL